MWEGWSAALTQSYAKTHDLLAQHKTAEAAQEFNAGVGATVRQMYSETSVLAPQRYAALDPDQWSSWMRRLYIQTRQAEKALAQPDQAAAPAAKQADPATSLTALREHFFALHEKTGKHEANDLIYAFYRQSLGGKPDAARLKQLADSLVQLPPPGKTPEQTARFEQAMKSWNARIEPILADGKITSDEAGQLRQAAGKLYRQYGIRLE